MRSTLVRSALAALLAVAAGSAAFAQAEKAPDEMTGPAIGEKAPEFTLKDQNGEEQALSEYLKGDKTVALVFYRSAHW